MAVTRRKVLVGALAGSGLVLGFMMRPRRYPLPLDPLDGEFAFDAWLKIAEDGIVTVAVPQVEMGQGVTTLIPQIVAHELGADWRRIAVEPAPGSAHYANLALAAKWAPLWMPVAPSLADEPDDLLTRRWAQDHRFNATADGTSIAAYEAPARTAAACARAMLTQAAAARWNVASEECAVANGFVTHQGKRLGFGALAEAAAALPVPSTPPLRPDAMAERSSQYPPGGELTYPRLDLPSKAYGSWTFAADVRLPDMVFAAIRHAPIGMNTSVSGLDEAAAKGIRGYLGLVHSPEGSDAWVAAVASDGWAAEQALKAIAPRFKVAAGADTDQIDAAMDEAMRMGKARSVHRQGDMDVIAGGLPLQLRYEVAPSIHATVETAAAAARFRDGRLEVWVGTQVPEATREAVARAVGIGAHDVVLYPMGIGGSFDRRLEFGQAVEAALIAKAFGKPVSLCWSRREEFRAGLPRSPVVAVMGARTNAEGGIAGWRARIAMPATAQEFGRRLFDHDTPFDAIDAAEGRADPMAVEGALPPYAIPNLVVDHVPARIGLPTARMRGNAHGGTAFFTESFVDELAHKAGREPLSYRMAMLGANPRLAECLQRVAALAQWGGGADASGQGIACHMIGEGRIAVIASARREAEGVRVDRLSAVADIGRIINVDIARQQIEGGLIFGLGLALGCSVRYEGGRPDSERLGLMGLPTLVDCPEIEIEFIDHRAGDGADPADPGELGVAAVAPAVANALYSATGLRLRRLPFFGEDI